MTGDYSRVRGPLRQKLRNRRYPRNQGKLDQFTHTLGGNGSRRWRRKFTTRWGGPPDDKRDDDPDKEEDEEEDTDEETESVTSSSQVSAHRGQH